MRQLIKKLLLLLMLVYPLTGVAQTEVISGLLHNSVDKNVKLYLY